MPETVLSPQQVSEIIKGLLDALRPTMSEVGHVALYEEAAKRLSAIARKDPPWGWRYVQGVEKGTIEPSRALTRAALALGAEMDGVPTILANSETVKVYARPGAIRPGSVILGESKACARPGCPVNFVPRVPWQRFCSRECVKAARVQREKKEPL